MDDNLAYVEIEQSQSEMSKENQNPDAASLRAVNVVWLSRGCKTHAFHQNGSLDVSVCGQVVLEELGAISQPSAKDTNCKRCEKYIRKLSNKTNQPGVERNPGHT